jgi:hypothetical protein
MVWLEESNPPGHRQPRRLPRTEAITAYVDCLAYGLSGPRSGGQSDKMG